MNENNKMHMKLVCILFRLNSIFAFEFGIMGTYEDDPGAENLRDLLQDKNCTLQSLG